MKQLFIIGNWKSYKTISETIQWFQEISNHKSQLSSIENKQIVICVPFTVLSLAKSLVEQYQLPIKLGAQNISPFDEGKYTGEINGKQLAEFAEYIIIGHSERRAHFSENEEMVTQKIEKALQYGLTPIVCVSDLSQISSLSVIANKVKQSQEIATSTSSPRNDGLIIAYEPLFAIGSGTPDSPENAEKISAEIQGKVENRAIIYGGSVTSQNVHSFTSMPTISGVLPGGASLNAAEFASLINNA